MRKLQSAILALAAFGAVGLASAQYVGPSAVQKATVATVLKSGVDDQHVVLQGVLVKKLGHEKYEFSDGTGTIRLEIDDKIFPHAPIDDKTRVEVSGELEKEFATSPEIDVKAIRVLSAP